MRLFVALRLDAPTHAAVRAVQQQLREGDRRSQVRWVEPHGIHLTFKFLGEVADERVGTVREALAGSVRDAPAPRLSLGGLGGFPNLRRPRVIWLGLVEVGEALAPLHRSIERAMETLGWEPESRTFQPHLTLGRVREEARGRPQELDARLLQALDRVRPPAVDARVQDSLALVRSHLSPAGARYENLQEWKLAS